MNDKYLMMNQEYINISLLSKNKTFNYQLLTFNYKKRFQQKKSII